MKRSENRNIGGFTLIELLVSMGIGMVVLAAVSTTFMSQARFYSAQEQVNEMEQNARGALDVITRELKMAGYKPNGGSFSGVTYSTSQLLIQADLDSSGTICTSSCTSITVNEQITYAHDNTNKRITRALGSGAAEVLADNITALTFTCYKADGATTTTTSSEIRQVKIDITATTAKPDPNYTANGGYRIYQVTATITPLNLAL
jgi:type IV pilus assembly protein PilW